MKTKETKKEVIAQATGGCCDLSTANSPKNEPCCEQALGSSQCCDKSESKKVNSVKTGCC